MSLKNIKQFKTHILIISLSISHLKSYADHIVGGHISLEQKSVESQEFVINLNLYINNNNFLNNEENAMQEEVYYVRIMKKSNDNIVRSIPLYFKKYEQIKFPNPACEIALNLSTRKYIYENIVNFSQDIFDEEEGYYIAFERCCREKNTANIENAGESGLVLIASLPSRLKYPIYSSPKFKTFDGTFVCSSNRYVFDFSAQDADGDVLRYSFTTPLKGHNTPNTSKAVAKPGPYDEVSWKSPWNINRIIIGEKNLDIDPESGLISLKTSTTGIFAFTVKVEKVRNGTVIGYTLHDYQITIAECLSSSPPKPVITYNGEEIQSLSLCSKEKITLVTEDGSDFFFQWNRNGLPLKNEILHRTRTDSSGIYTVSKYFVGVCAEGSLSEPFNLEFSKPTAPSISKSSDDILCFGDTLFLAIESPIPNFTYSWVNTNSEEIHKGLNFGITEEIKLQVFGLNDSTNCTTEVANINPTFNSKPERPVYTLSSTILCKQTDQISLYIDNENDGSLIFFLKEADEEPKPIAQNPLEISKPGKFRVLAVTEAGCEASSEAFEISAADSATVDFTFDDNVCETFSQLNLSAVPSGGHFTGQNVEGTTLILTNIDSSVVFYEVEIKEGCKIIDSVVVKVGKEPSLNLNTEYRIFRNDSLEIDTSPLGLFTEVAVISGDNSYNFDNGTLFFFPSLNTEFKLQYASEYGCIASETFRVIVDDVVRIPSAFSPNNDGLNDYWVVPDLQRYSNITVSIYNLYGEKIFFSERFTGWDGRYNGNVVPLGIYTYQIESKKDGVSFEGYIRVVKR